MRISKEVIDRILTMYELAKLRVRLAENRSEIENIWELGRYLYWLDKNKKLNISDLSKKLLKVDRSWDFETERLELIKNFYTIYKDLDVFNSLLATVEVYKHEMILNRCKTNIERMYYLDNIRTNTDGICNLGGSIKNHDLWIASWQFKSEFGLHSATVSKVKRNGELISRELKDLEGKTYFTVYMVEDNQKFFKKHKKTSRSNKKWKFVDKDGVEMLL